MFRGGELSKYRLFVTMASRQLSANLALQKRNEKQAREEWGAISSGKGKAMWTRGLGK